MNKGYRIRAAVPGDLEAVVALDREMDTLPHWRIGDYVAALSLLGREREMSGICRCFFVAEVSSAVVGFAVGKVTSSEAVAELESVGVAERMRRSGVGRALCEAVIEWSERMGAAGVELEVRSQSAGPIALYQRMGFVAVGRRPRYYRQPVDDAVLMRLGLGRAGATGSTHGPDL